MYRNFNLFIRFCTAIASLGICRSTKIAQWYTANYYNDYTTYRLVGTVPIGIKSTPLIRRAVMGRWRKIGG